MACDTIDGFSPMYIGLCIQTIQELFVARALITTGVSLSYPRRNATSGEFQSVFLLVRTRTGVSKTLKPDA